MYFLPCVQGEGNNFISLPTCLTISIHTNKEGMITEKVLCSSEFPRNNNRPRGLFSLSSTYSSNYDKCPLSILFVVVSRPILSFCCTAAVSIFKFFPWCLLLIAIFLITLSPFDFAFCICFIDLGCIEAAGKKKKKNTVDTFFCCPELAQCASTLLSMQIFISSRHYCGL